MFRSLTDAQLAERHDPKPWLEIYSGHALRFSKDDGGKFSPRKFAPRVETIPSRDPLPYVKSGNRTRFGPRWFAHDPYNLAFRPRPEFARPPVNPILSAMRAEGWSAQETLNSLDRGDWDHSLVTFDVFADARKVLERLAALS